MLREEGGEYLTTSQVLTLGPVSYFHRPGYGALSVQLKERLITSYGRTLLINIILILIILINIIITIIYINDTCDAAGTYRGFQYIKVQSE